VTVAVVAAFLLSAHAACGAQSAGARFHLPPAPNTEKLLRGMVHFAPPLSDYPGLFGGEGPRAHSEPSTGARFADFSSEEVREVLAARRCAEGGPALTSNGAEEPNWAEGVSREEAEWDSDAAEGELRELLLAIEVGSRATRQDDERDWSVIRGTEAREEGSADPPGPPHRAWSADVVDVVVRRVVSCPVWWLQPEFVGGTSKQPLEPKPPPPSTATPQIVPRGVWAEALAKTEAAVRREEEQEALAAQQKQQRRRQQYVRRGVRESEVARLRRLLAYNGGTGVCAPAAAKNGSTYAGNGGAVDTRREAARGCLRYLWAQDATSCVVSFEVPQTCRARHVSVTVAKKRLLVTVSLAAGGVAEGECGLGGGEAARKGGEGGIGGGQVMVRVDRRLEYCVLDGEAETEGCWELVDVSPQLRVLQVPQKSPNNSKRALLRCPVNKSILQMT